MKFSETELKEPYIIELEEHIDERGFFARTFCINEFAEVGIDFNPVQRNLSYNKYKHTLRGMHYQEPPYEEAKLVSCVKGSIYDVIIDIREDSSTLNKWIGLEMSAVNRKMLFVPKGFAHGFLTLEDDTEVSYLMSDFYKPGVGGGIHWDDPFYHIEWPAQAEVISEKDKNWPYKE